MVIQSKKKTVLIVKERDVSVKEVERREKEKRDIQKIWTRKMGTNIYLAKIMCSVDVVLFAGGSPIITLFYSP